MIGSLLIAVLVLCLVYWVLTLIPLPPGGRQVVNIIIAIAAVLWLLKIFGVNF